MVNLEENIPFYRLRGSIDDTSLVKEVHQGDFYVRFFLCHRNGEKMVKPIIDQDVIFGTETYLHVPRQFLKPPLHNLLEQPHNNHQIKDPVVFHLLQFH
ncbi:hypothetical protein [Sutcliffiella deserti]|uniref:hypothetical protein n=1 Tax=Sutcliffiella deserti TaxID=2875501 RepID=UPI001CBE7D68|nr:hypothetical protein [Sutcliffiella deserti]